MYHRKVTSSLDNKYSIGQKEVTKTPSDETKRSAMALVNLYEDANHQKTVGDLESFAGVAPTDAITPKHIMDWYYFLGLEFDTQNGRFLPDKAKNLSFLFYILINKETNIIVILSDVFLISLGRLIYYLFKKMQP